MRSKLLFIALVFCADATAQLRGSFEQLYYMQEGEFSAGPVATFQTPRNKYLEVRYNYEELNTISLYLGKVFSREASFSYSVVPILGGVLGRFNGGSAGLNVDLEYERLYFSSQSQYTFSAEEETTNFYFTWSELGHSITDWLYAGAAGQMTSYPRTGSTTIEPGIVLGTVFGQWTVSTYGLKPFAPGRMFICSILWEW